MQTILSELVEKLANRETPERTYIFRESLDNLSDDAKVIVKIVFSSPTKFAKITNSHSPKMARSEILRILREDEGWGWPKCWRAFDELKLMLQQ